MYVFIYVCVYVSIYLSIGLDFILLLGEEVVNMVEANIYLQAI